MNFSREGSLPNHGHEAGSSSWLEEEDGDGSDNSPIGVESCGKDSYSMGSGGKGRRKENQRDTRTTESEDNVAAAPRQRRQKACWYFESHE